MDSAYTNIILITCTLAVGHAIFSATSLLIMSKKLSNRLLALLLLLLAVRIGKSVIGYFFRPGTVYLISSAGAIAMALTGPIFFLLIQSLFRTREYLSLKTYLHFLPAALLAIALPFTDWFMLSPSYFIFTAHVCLYLILSYAFVIDNRHTFRADDLKWKWSLILLAAMTILWVSFVLQISVYQPIVYFVNIVTAAVIFYSLSLWAISRSRIFLPEPTTNADQAEMYDALGKRIKILLDRDEVFIDPNLNVTLLAQHLRSQPYLVSKSINHFFNKSFSEVMMEYRIRKAEQLLLSPESRRYTIESIAYESGFNTLSAFYSSFKKIHKTTPAQFRTSKGQDNMKIA